MMSPGPIIDAIAALAGLTPHSMLVIGLIFAGLAAATLYVARLRRQDPSRDRSELESRIRSWWIIVSLLTAALVMGRAATILLFAFISYLALKEYLSIIPTRRQDRAVLFFVYLAIPVQFWLVWAEWYGFFIIFVPVYMFMFLGAAMVWGTLMVTAGGGLAWLLSALFSDVRGGFFLPILTSAGVGLAGTVASGVLATLAIWPFFLYAVYQAGPQAANVNYWTNRGARNPVPWIGVLAGFIVWSTGVVTTSVAGPLMAAWVYRERGTPRNAEAGTGYYE